MMDNLMATVAPIRKLVYLAADDPLDGVAEGGSKIANTLDSLKDWAGSAAGHDWLIFKPLKIIALLIIVHIVQRVINAIVDKAVRRHNTSSTAKAEALARATLPEGEDLSIRAQASLEAEQARRSSRMETLASVAKSAIAVILWGFAILNVLSILGMNVGPLVASAGVIGVALGFGAQSLVKDFLSGICMLLEDQFGVGDEVNLDSGIIGVVEKVSLRLTIVRDIDGVAWYVRNGEILRVGNLTDQYSIARLEIPVAHSVDYSKAAEVIRTAATEACREEAIVHAVIDEPSFKGVSNFDVDHVEYRVVITTLPGEYAGVSRYVKGRILDAMTANGISVPYPHGIGGTAFASGSLQDEPASDAEV